MQHTVTRLSHLLLDDVVRCLAALLVEIRLQVIDDADALALGGVRVVLHDDAAALARAHRRRRPGVPEEKARRREDDMKTRESERRATTRGV